MYFFSPWPEPAGLVPEQARGWGFSKLSSSLLHKFYSFSNVVFQKMILFFIFQKCFSLIFSYKFYLFSNFSPLDLNLLDWSHNNHVAVALAGTVYLWNASDGSIVSLTSIEPPDYVCSVSWIRDGEEFFLLFFDSLKKCFFLRNFFLMFFLFVLTTVSPWLCVLRVLNTRRWAVFFIPFDSFRKCFFSCTYTFFSVCFFYAPILCIVRCGMR